MKQFSLSINRYRKKVEKNQLKEYGWIDQTFVDETVKRYAIAKVKYKRGQLSKDPLKGVNLFKNDPNCKNCGKNK